MTAKTKTHPVETVLGAMIVIGFAGGVICGASYAALSVLHAPAASWFGAFAAFFGVFFVASFVMIQFIDFDALRKSM